MTLSQRPVQVFCLFIAFLSLKNLIFCSELDDVITSAIDDDYFPQELVGVNLKRSFGNVGVTTPDANERKRAYLEKDYLDRQSREDQEVPLILDGEDTEEDSYYDEEDTEGDSEYDGEEREVVDQLFDISGLQTPEHPAVVPSVSYQTPNQKSSFDAQYMNGAWNGNYPVGVFDGKFVGVPPAFPASSYRTPERPFRPNDIPNSGATTGDHSTVSHGQNPFEPANGNDPFDLFFDDNDFFGAPAGLQANPVPNFPFPNLDISNGQRLSMPWSQSGINPAETAFKASIAGLTGGPLERKNSVQMPEMMPSSGDFDGLFYEKLVEQVFEDDLSLFDSISAAKPQNDRAHSASLLIDDLTNMAVENGAGDDNSFSVFSPDTGSVELSESSFASQETSVQEQQPPFFPPVNRKIPLARIVTNESGITTPDRTIGKDSKSSKTISRKIRLDLPKHRLLEGLENPFYDPISADERECKPVAFAPKRQSPDSQFNMATNNFHAGIIAKLDKKRADKAAEIEKLVNKEKCLYKQWLVALEHNQIPDFKSVKLLISPEHALEFVKKAASKAGNEVLVFEEALHDFLIDYYLPNWTKQVYSSCSNLETKIKNLETDLCKSLRDDIVVIMQNLVSKMATPHIFEKAMQAISPWLTDEDFDDIFRTVIVTGLSVPWPMVEPRREEYRAGPPPVRPAELLSDKEIEALPPKSEERYKQEAMAFKYKTTLEDYQEKEKRLSNELSEAQFSYRFQKNRFERAKAHLATMVRFSPDCLNRAAESKDCSYLKNRNLPLDCFRDYVYFGRFYSFMLIKEFDFAGFLNIMNQNPIFPRTVATKKIVMDHFLKAIDHFVSWARYIHFPFESNQLFESRKQLFNYMMGEVRATFHLNLSDLISIALELRLGRLIEAILVFSQDEIRSFGRDLDFIMNIFTENQPVLTVELGTMILAYIPGWRFAEIDRRLLSLANQPNISERRQRLFSALREVSYVLSERYTVAAGLQTILYDLKVYDYFPEFGNSAPTPYLIHAMRGLALRSFGIPFIQTYVTWMVNESFTWREALKAVNMFLKPFGILFADGTEAMPLPHDEPSNPIHSHIKRLDALLRTLLKTDVIPNLAFAEVHLQEDLERAYREVAIEDSEVDVNLLDFPEEMQRLDEIYRKYPLVYLNDSQLLERYRQYPIHAPIMELNADFDDE